MSFRYPWIERHQKLSVAGIDAFTGETYMAPPQAPLWKSTMDEMPPLNEEVLFVVGAEVHFGYRAILSYANDSYQWETFTPRTREAESESISAQDVRWWMPLPDVPEQRP